MVPASPWLSSTRYEKPVIEATPARVSWRLADGRAPRWWLVQVRQRGQWASQLVPGTRVSGKTPESEAFSLRAVDAGGNLGEATVVELLR